MMNPLYTGFVADAAAATVLVVVVILYFFVAFQFSFLCSQYRKYIYQVNSSDIMFYSECDT